jgi:hypothetical protein
MLVAGFVVWSVAFVGLYGLQALGCAFAWGEWHRPVLVGTYLLSLLPLGWLAVQRPSGTHSALWTSAVWANRAALAAGVLAFAPVTFASACI